jgi:hypothetical protein
MKKLPLVPNGLPFRLDLVKWIRFATLAGHWIINQESRKIGKENGFAVSDAQRP